MFKGKSPNVVSERKKRKVEEFCWGVFVKGKMRTSVSSESQEIDLSHYIVTRITSYSVYL